MEVALLVPGSAVWTLTLKMVRGPANVTALQLAKQELTWSHLVMKIQTEIVWRGARRCLGGWENPAEVCLSGVERVRARRAELPGGGA